MPRWETERRSKGKQENGKTELRNANKCNASASHPTATIDIPRLFCLHHVLTEIVPLLYKHPRTVLPQIWKLLPVLRSGRYCNQPRNSSPAHLRLQLSVTFPNDQLVVYLTFGPARGTYRHRTSSRRFFGERDRNGHLASEETPPPKELVMFPASATTRRDHHPYHIVYRGSRRVLHRMEACLQQLSPRLHHHAHRDRVVVEDQL